MGVLNMTPDSFFEDSRVFDEQHLLDKVHSMVEQGVDIIDIGGASTRPGADEVDEDEELNRVVNAIRLIRTVFEKIIISIDTFRSKVAEAAIIAGADLINDVTGGRFDEAIFDVAAKYNVPFVLMHSRGSAKNMQNLTQYDNVVKEVIFELSERLNKAYSKGVKDVIIDPGFGFAKTLEQNYELLRSLTSFHVLNCPLLVGVSRKSMICKKIGVTPEEALNGTTILNTFAVLKGANILRVHDVKEAKEIITLLDTF